ncbi:MAG: hypothetical protein ACPHFO_09360, partial [Acidimicrobiales bacterium]
AARAGVPRPPVLLAVLRRRGAVGPLGWPRASGVLGGLLAASGLVIGGAATLATALRLIGEPAPAVWLRSMTEIAIAALSVTVLAVVWNEGGDDWVARLIGIESIAVAAGTLLIPVLARFGRGAQMPAPAEFACPHCGEAIDLSSIER